MSAPEFVVVVGSDGYAGRRHSSLWRERGLVVRGVDHRLGGVFADLAEAVGDDPARVAVDICTPTSDHISTMHRAYQLGVRNFLVEKPAGMTAAQWREALDSSAEATMLVVQNYLVTEAMRQLRSVVAARGLRPVRVVSRFDKDRRAQSLAGRGADGEGRLPHVFRIEVPHQLYVADALLGHLDVIEASTQPMRLGELEIADHGAGTILLAGPHGTAKLSSALTRPLDRGIEVHCASGDVLTASFAVRASNTSRLVIRHPCRLQETVYVGPDDGLARTLDAALDAFRGTAAVPDELSPTSAATVLRHIDDAIAHASTERVSVP